MLIKHQFFSSLFQCIFIYNLIIIIFSCTPFILLNDFTKGFISHNPTLYFECRSWSTFGKLVTEVYTNSMF